MIQVLILIQDPTRESPTSLHRVDRIIITIIIIREFIYIMRFGVYIQVYKRFGVGLGQGIWRCLEGYGHCDM